MADRDLEEKARQVLANRERAAARARARAAKAVLRDSSKNTSTRSQSSRRSSLQTVQEGEPDTTQAQAARERNES